MSRYLFVTLPLAGHAYAAAALAGALRQHGHDVAWAGPETYLRPLVGPDTTVYATGMRPYRGPRERGTVALKSLWDGFVVPFARFMLPQVDKAVQDFQPDAVVVDQHALAGAAAAQRHGLPWATLVTQQLELTRPFAALPKVDAWCRGRVDAVAALAGLPPGSPDLRFSPHLVLALTSQALTGTAALPPQTRLVGPVRVHDDSPFDWPDRDPGRPAVLVSMGTLAQDLAADFYGRMAHALDGLQAIVVAPPDALPEPPPQVLVRPRVPLLALLPSLDAVVCHGGHNTVTEALAHGVPLVVAPIKYDQPVVARQVTDAGAGVRVSFRRASPDQLRAAIHTVLDDPAIRTAAQRVAASFTAAGGALAAVSELENLGG